jgi:hypothetical protein
MPSKKTRAKKPRAPRPKKEPARKRCKYGHINCVEGPACEEIRKLVGNPPLWKPEYNRQIIEHFSLPNSAPYREHFDDHEKVQLIPARVPTFEGFASKLEIVMDTLYEWAKEENREKYPGFSDAFTRAHALQKEFLLANGSAGAGNPSFIQFFLKNNHGMKDTKDLTNDGGKFEPPVIVNPGGPMWAEEEA